MNVYSLVFYIHCTNVHIGAGALCGGVEGWGRPVLPGHLPRAVGGETGVGVQWGAPPQGEGTLPVVIGAI